MSLNTAQTARHPSKVVLVLTESQMKRYRKAPEGSTVALPFKHEFKISIPAGFLISSSGGKGSYTLLSFSLAEKRGENDGVGYNFSAGSNGLFRIGDYGYPGNPMNDRAVGYLLQGMVKNAISNYGKITLADTIQIDNILYKL